MDCKLSHYNYESDKPLFDFSDILNQQSSQKKIQDMLFKFYLPSIGVCLNVLTRNSSKKTL